MLEELLRYLNNWFCVDAHVGTFKVEGGRIALPFLKDGQYFRIVGSVFNDGLYQQGYAVLPNDEEFFGGVWALAIPKAVITLSEEIEEWQKKNAEIAASPYQSESFGGYSYSKKSDQSGGAVTSWHGAFKSRLNKWRKI